VKSTESVR